MPICVEHACEFRCSKNEFDVLELLKDGRPYRISSGDKWTCPIGGESVVVGFGQPVHREHPDFAEWMKHVALTVPER